MSELLLDAKEKKKELSSVVNKLNQLIKDAEMLGLNIDLWSNKVDKEDCLTTNTVLYFKISIKI